MKWLSTQAWLPLLSKELAEQAARKRTYVVRVVYAVGLFACFLLFFFDQLSYGAVKPWEVMGTGKGMFRFLVVVQFVGIYLFLPATMSGALAGEKEADSLSLLFLTDLRPWEIVLQKYFGRLIPMFTFLLLSLPLLAISYSFGGISGHYLCAGVLLLLLTCLQVGALALMCSSWCTSTVQSLICCYVLGALFYASVAIFGVLFYVFRGYAGPFPVMDESVTLRFFPPFVFADTEGDSFESVVVRSIPIVVSTLSFLAMARTFLVRRAFVSRRSVALGLLKRLDAFWHRANKSLGGIVLIREPDTLPKNHPVLWRETHKKLLGKWSHLFRILLVIELPVVLIAGSISLAGGSLRGSQVEGLPELLGLLWVLAALILLVAGAGAFASERSRRTLDVLLATPMSGRDIVRQKAWGFWRAALVLAIPLLTVMFFEALVEGVSAMYLFSFFLSVAVYFPLLIWFSLWIGLKARTRLRAVLLALAVFAFWCVLPAALVAVLRVLNLGPTVGDWTRLFFLLGPASIIWLTETWAFRWAFRLAPLIPVIVNYLGYTAAALLLRWLCLRNADRYLGRVEQGAGSALRARPDMGVTG